MAPESLKSHELPAGHTMPLSAVWLSPSTTSTLKNEAGEVQKFNACENFKVAVVKPVRLISGE